MGIDTDVKTIFGWYLEYQFILEYGMEHQLECDCHNKKGRHIMTPSCHQDDFDIVYEIDGYTFEIISANSWYDCELSERMWYFGIELDDTVPLADLKQLIAMTESPLFEPIQTMAEALGAGGEPGLHSSVHQH
jgi:hypothetical protein